MTDGSPLPRADTPWLQKASAVAFAVSVAILVASNVVGSVVVPGHDPVSDTISDLAVGPGAYIQDFGLYAHTFGLLILAAGLWSVHGGERSWTVGVLAIIVMAVATFLIGFRHEYGDGDDEGIVLHYYFVYALSAALVVAPASLVFGLRRWGQSYVRAAIVFLVFWPLAAPVFFILGSGYDGIYERFLMLAANVWLLTLAWGLWRGAPGRA